MGIREYREEDLGRVLEIWYAASLVAHPFLDEEFLAAERENIIGQHLPVAETYVYESKGRVLGFISLLGSEVGAVFVDPKAQRRGIGRALMDHACELKGELELDVFEENSIGRAFYELYGFELVSRRMDRESGHAQLRLRLPEG